MTKLWRWLPVFLITGTIFYLSGIPDLHIVNRNIFPAWLTVWVSQHTVRIGDKGFFSYTLSLEPDFIAHKIGHISVYGLLGVVVAIAVRSKNWALFFVLLYAFSDEVHQYFTPGRSCRFWDIVLDVLAGWAAIQIYNRTGRKR